MEDMQQYLLPGKYVDSGNPAVIAYAHKVVGDEKDPVQQAVKLYYAIRDDFQYNPYDVDLSEEGLKASSLLKRGHGYCVEKGSLLAACARVFGIPSRLGFADVRNHINSAKLMAVLRSDILAFHGYTELFLNGKWVKATPAFNKTLCEKLKVKPLEFNGLEDSIFQENDGPDGRFMDYVYDHGIFADVPREYFIETLKKNYPHLFENGTHLETIFSSGVKNKMDISCTTYMSWFRCPKAASAKASLYKGEVYHSITQIAPLLWESIVPPDKAFMSIPYLTAFEQSISGNIGFRYLILYKAGKPVGVAICQVISFDGSNIGLAEGEGNATFFKKFLTGIVNRFSLRLLVIGNTFMTGEYGLWFNDPAINDTERFHLLQYGLNVLIKQERKFKSLSGIVIKDFFKGNEGVVKPLIGKGYLEFTVQPDMILNLDVKWKTFDDYLNAMSSKYRVRARKAIKMMDGIETRLMDVAQIESRMPVMEELYDQIIGNAPFKMGKFDLQHIPRLARSMPNGFYCLGFYKDNALVGFISLYDNENGELVAGMMGMDKHLQKSHDLYLNILYSIVRYAIEHTHTRLVMGRTAMEIKSSLGAVPYDMYVYAHHLFAPFNWIIKPIVRRLTYVKPWHQRTPFK